jgi:hypothetical protein
MKGKKEEGTCGGDKVSSLALTGFALSVDSHPRNGRVRTARENRDQTVSSRTSTSIRSSTIF